MHIKDPHGQILMPGTQTLMWLKTIISDSLIIYLQAKSSLVQDLVTGLFKNTLNGFVYWRHLVWVVTPHIYDHYFWLFNLSSSKEFNGPRFGRGWIPIVLTIVTVGHSIGLTHPPPSLPSYFIPHVISSMVIPQTVVWWSLMKPAASYQTFSR